MKKFPIYTLYWKSTALGTVEHTDTDFPWMYGRFIPQDLSPVFGDLFRFMTAEDSFEQDPPFDGELLADENWLLKSDDGEDIEICIPAISLSDAEIRWRLR